MTRRSDGVREDAVDAISETVSEANRNQRTAIDASAPTVASDNDDNDDNDNDGRTGDASTFPSVAPRIYRIDREVARGGMGRVLRARDHRLQREVAIKEILTSSVSPIVRQRFEREALLTARLQHPNIVTIYEAGRWPNGTPFYAMRLVDGTPLNELIANATTWEKRLELLPNILAAAEAIAYAHDAKIIHRDLKPQNILIGKFGETVVIDWGLAKDLTDREPELASTINPDEDDADLTIAGVVLGTPAYMPPEQARGDVVDERADVYSLGAILYHALAGVPPYNNTTVAKILADVRDGSPPALETRTHQVSADLAAIVAKSMTREASGRYASASTLASELRKYMTGQLVASHEYTTLEHLRRFARKHRAAVIVGLSMVAILAIVVTVALRSIIAARDDAQDNGRLARQARDQQIVDAGRATALSDPTAALAILKRLPLDADESILREAWLVAASTTTGFVANDVFTSPMPYVEIFFDRNNSIIMLASRPDGSLGIWRRRDSKVEVVGVNVGALRRHAVRALDGSYVAWLNGRRVVVWRTDQDVAIDTGEYADELAVSASGLEMREKDGKCKLIDPTTPHQVTGCPAPTHVSYNPITHRLAVQDRSVVIDAPAVAPRSIVMSRDGKSFYMIFGGLAQESSIVFSDSNLENVAVRPGQVLAADFGRSSEELLVIGVNGVYRMTVSDDQSREAYHYGPVARVGALSSQTSRVATASGGSIRVVTIGEGELNVTRTGLAEIRSIAITQDGDRIAASDGDQVRVWALHHRVAVKDRVWRVGLTPDKSSFVFGVHNDEFLRSIDLYRPDGVRQTLNIDQAKPDGQIGGPGRKPDGAVALSVDGQHVAVSFDKNRIAVGAFDKAPKVVTITSSPTKLALSQDADKLLIVAGEASVFGDSATAIPANDGYITRDGRVVVLGTDGLYVDRRRIAEFGDCPVSGINPDESTLAIGCRDGTLATYDLATGKRTLIGEHIHATQLAYSPSGILAIADNDSIRFSAEGRVRRGPSQPILHMMWVGERLQTWGEIESWLWDPRTARPVPLSKENTTQCAKTAMFSVHGNYVRSMKLPPENPSAFRRWLEVETRYSIDAL